jgi:mersacidin/lichenicidin family type 2 lantibiotic
MVQVGMRESVQMSNIVRAWKDETYRYSLCAEEQATLPTNPAGAIELTQAELEAIAGADDDSPDPDGNNDEAKTQQIVTYQPIIATIVIFAPTAPQCNNTASPASSTSVLSELFR